MRGTFLDRTVHVARSARTVLVGALLSPVVPLQAQPVTTAPERAVAATVARIDSALARRDRAALEPLVAPGFTWVHASDGRVDTREVWLANAAVGNALSALRPIRSVHGVEYTLHGRTEPHTAVRLARVRLRDTVHVGEVWLRQVQVLVRDVGGPWRLAHGQGTLVYDGPPQDTVLLKRYAGTYEIAPGRALVLAWNDGALFATMPSGARSQIFLASPTEEAVRVPISGQLRFTLGPDGAPVAASLVRNERELWRGTRRQP